MTAEISRFEYTWQVATRSFLYFFACHNYHGRSQVHCRGTIASGEQKRSVAEPIVLCGVGRDNGRNSWEKRYCQSSQEIQVCRMDVNRWKAHTVCMRVLELSTAMQSNGTIFYPRCVTSYSEGKNRFPS